MFDGAFDACWFFVTFFTDICTRFSEIAYNAYNDSAPASLWFCFI